MQIEGKQSGSSPGSRVPCLDFVKPCVHRGFKQSPVNEVAQVDLMKPPMNRHLLLCLRMKVRESPWGKNARGSRKSYVNNPNIIILIL